MNRDKLREYFRVTGLMDGVVKMVEMAETQMMPYLKADVAPHDADEIDRQVQRYNGLLKNQINALEEKFIEIYSEFYTEEDVDALLAFYNTPVAKKMREITPQLTERCMAVSNEFNQGLLRQLTNIAVA